MVRLYYSYCILLQFNSVIITLYYWSLYGPIMSFTVRHQSNFLPVYTCLCTFYAGNSANFSETKSYNRAQQKSYSVQYDKRLNQEQSGHCFVWLLISVIWFVIFDR